MPPAPHCCAIAWTRVARWSANAGRCATRPWRRCATTAADMVLLDIQMPGRDGLEWAAELKAQRAAAGRWCSSPRTPSMRWRPSTWTRLDYLTKPVQARSAVRCARPRVPGAGAAASGCRPGGTARNPVLVVSDRGRVLRLPLSRSAVPEGRAEVRDAAHRHSAATCWTTRSPTWSCAWATRVLRVHRNALVARRPCARWSCAACRTRTTRATTPSPAGPCRWLPLDEWLAVSRRQVSAVRAALASG